jgi:hypothetical protein
MSRVEASRSLKTSALASVLQCLITQRACVAKLFQSLLPDHKQIRAERTKRKIVCDSTKGVYDGRLNDGVGDCPHKCLDQKAKAKR